MVCNFAVDSQT